MNKEISALKLKIVKNYVNNKLPDKSHFMNQLHMVNRVLEDEDPDIRPLDRNRETGGLIYLKKNIPTIIVPDLHGRGDFLLSVLFSKHNGEKSILEHLQEYRMQLVCIGDGMHAESRALERWKLAFEEYKVDYIDNEYMTREMAESLFVMQTVILLKTHFPGNFHYLKGNHDNILNENGNGNYPFAKFCYEGEMVTHFMKRFYGKDFLEDYSRFEKNLPLLCIGENFLISHARPSTFFSQDEIREYRSNPGVVYGLTWTDNGASRPGSVKRMIDTFIENNSKENRYHFGGHRPVQGLYRLFEDENYVQFHNPDKFVIVFIKPGKEISLDRDVVKLKNIIQVIID